MRRRRRRSILIAIAVLLVLAGVYYVFRSSVTSSPVYRAGKILYVFKRGGDYRFLVVLSDRKMVRIYKARESLYDPKTRSCLCGDAKDAVDFFERVFSFSPDFSFYLDLSGENLEEFSKAMLKKGVEDLDGLLKDLARRGSGIFDVFRVGSVARKIRFFSSLDGPALYKLLISLSGYGIDEEEIEGMTKEPLRITVAGRTVLRIYLTEEEKERIAQELK